MILGCHVIKGVDSYRQQEIDEAQEEMVRVAYAQGVAEAFKRSHPEVMTDATIRRHYMVPWFLHNFVLYPNPEYMRPKFADFMDEVDLAPVRAVAEAAKTLSKSIEVERDIMRRRDDPDLDDFYMEAEAPPDLEGTLVRHADGRPRPVFHVTPMAFDHFAPMSHFGTALAVSRHAYNMVEMTPHDRFNVLSCWLDVRRPLVLEDGGTMAST